MSEVKKWAVGDTFRCNDPDGCYMNDELFHTVSRIQSEADEVRGDKLFYSDGQPDFESFMYACHVHPVTPGHPH